MSLQPKTKKFAKTLLFVLLVATVIGAFILLSEQKQARPMIPDDANHNGLGEWQACLKCHAHGQVAALKPSHPLSNEKCLRCHSFPQKALAPR